MGTFAKGSPVVYQPGFLGTNLSEAGRELPDRLRRVVHGIVEAVDGDKVAIDAERKEDSGWFPVTLVEHDCSGDPLF